MSEDGITYCRKFFRKSVSSSQLRSSIFGSDGFSLEAKEDLIALDTVAMDLQPPSVLTQLPRPLHASTGKVHIGEVYRLADSKKRKRYEISVAVDGEAVNIYNVWLDLCFLEKTWAKW